ncbi:hypothetical protein EON67_09710 [archaeon]|nr:MAG: hypothetical protein EON67_09710 [archaeon]
MTAALVAVVRLVCVRGCGALSVLLPAGRHARSSQRCNILTRASTVHPMFAGARACIQSI